MKHLIITILYLIVSSQSSTAQKQKFNPSFSYNDVSFSVGMYTNVKREQLGNGTVYSVDYGNFSLFNGLGFRGGISYIDKLDSNINAISLPLKFALRTPLPRRMTAIERLESAVQSQMGNYKPSIVDAILSQITPRFEINAGISPGYISGNGYYSEVYNSSSGWYKDGISVKRRFMLTADAGVRLSFRIWRFNIVFGGQYHYLITNNYNRNSTLPSFDGKLSRSYFSLNLGLSFML